MKESARKAGDILKQMLEERGLLAQSPLAILHREWGSFIGEDLADHCRPAEVFRGVCVVEADHPGWLQLAGMRKGRLLDAIRVNQSVAGITDIRFRLSRHVTDPTASGGLQGDR